MTSLLTYKAHSRSLLKIGIPIVIGQLGIIILSLFDTLMVGRYGTAELAAASFVNQMFNLVIMFATGFSYGLTPIVGRLFGTRQFAAIGGQLKNGLFANLLMALLLSLGMGVLYFNLHLLGQPAELLPLIRPYYLIVLSSLVPMAIFNCFQQMANGTTDTAMPMWIMLGMNALNIGGNYLLIFGHLGLPELGLVGAGISTLLSRIVGMLVIVALVMTRRRYLPYREGFLHKAALPGEHRHALKVALPVMFQSGIETVLWSFGAVVCGWFGTLQLAGYQVVVTISQLGFMTYLSFGIATSIRVANYMGLRDYVAVDRISSAGLHINLVLGTLASLVFLLGSEHLLGLFTDDPQVIAVAVSLIIPLVLYQYGDAIQITYANALRGTSHVTPLLWISIVSYLLVGIPLLLLLSITFGMQSIGVYYSFSGALFLAAILLYKAFRRALRRSSAL
jgi:MATE family multidrug resistance protein